MANDLSAAIPKLIAMGAQALREYCVMPRLINTDLSAMAREKGDTIDIVLPSAVPAIDVVPGVTATNPGDMTLGKVPLTLSNWKEAPFYLTDKDISSVLMGVAPMQATEAVRALANEVNASIFALFTKIYGVVGTDTVTTPFGNFSAPSPADATSCRKVLNQQLAPLSPRYMVLDPTAEAAALNITGFLDASFRGDTGGISEGQIGRKLGFNWYSDQTVPSFVSGTLAPGSAGCIAKASTNQAVGLTTIVCTTGAATGSAALKVGDVVAIVGQPTTYVVTAAVTQAAAAADFNLQISPPLKKALTGGEVVTLKTGIPSTGATATRVQNLAFHRDCFALASRPLLDTAVTQADRERMMSVTDPVSGLALRLEVTREAKRTRWSFDLLWGVCCPRPEFGVRLFG
jgi:hypothetical protein